VKDDKIKIMIIKESKIELSLLSKKQHERGYSLGRWEGICMGMQHGYGVCMVKCEMYFPRS
jgi:hypothetical protein